MSVTAVRSKLELLFGQQALGSRVIAVRNFEREYRFDPARKWQFDFAWLPYWVALEIEGGLFIGGRHVRGVEIELDMEKSNAAIAGGWRVFRASADMVNDGRAIALIESVLSG